MRIRTATAATLVAVAMGTGAYVINDHRGSPVSVADIAPATPGQVGKPAIGLGPVARAAVQPQPPKDSCRYRYTTTGQPLPDPNCTPGAINPEVTQANLHETVCRADYIEAIRPPASISDVEKRLNAASYSYTGPMESAGLDHLVALTLGGDPNDVRNLWVQPPSPSDLEEGGASNPKDVVESELSAAVCQGRVPLADAQAAIATDWTSALERVGLR